MAAFPCQDYCQTLSEVIESGTMWSLHVNDHQQGAYSHHQQLHQQFHHRVRPMKGCGVTINVFTCGMESYMYWGCPPVWQV